MIKLLAAKQRRKEMWSAIDVNDNGYASLSEITRVSGSFLWCENYVFLWCSNQMTKGSNVWYGKLVCSHDDDQGVRDVIDSDDLFDSRPAINRAFHHCRKLAKVQNNCHRHPCHHCGCLFNTFSQICRVIVSMGTTFWSSKSFEFSSEPSDSSLNTIRRSKGLETLKKGKYETNFFSSGWTLGRTKGSPKKSSQMTPSRKR